MTPARVSLVAHRFAEAHPTGIGRYYREVAKALAARQDDATTYEIASPTEPDEPDWLPDGLHHRPITGNREALLLAWCLAGRPPLDRRLGGPDLVHVLHPWVATPTKVPLVTTVHDLMPILEPQWYGRKERWAYARGMAHVRDHATRVVAVSSWVAELLTTHSGVEPDRITVVHEGVARGFHRAADDGLAIAEVADRYGVRPGRFLVTVGAISVRKNLFPVLRALAQLPPIDPGHPDLVVAGPPGLGADVVLAEVSRLGLDDRVRIGGFVPDADLPLLVAGAAALVHPSRDEGFGLTPLEAMAAGTASISSNCGSLPEVVGDAGLLVDPDDADAWAAAIATVTTSDDERAELERRGRQHVERFTWDATARGIADVHRALLGR